MLDFKPQEIIFLRFFGVKHLSKQIRQVYDKVLNLMKSYDDRRNQYVYDKCNKSRFCL